MYSLKYSQVLETGKPARRFTYYVDNGKTQDYACNLKCSMCVQLSFALGIVLNKGYNLIADRTDSANST